MTSLPLLPLTPFERYMLDDSQPGYSMEVTMQVYFGGVLDTNLLAETLPFALARHPLMTARVTGRGRSRCWQFVPPPPTAEVLDVAPWSAPFLADRRAHFDLENSPGMRLQVQTNASETLINFAAHHAVSDGVGVFQFVADWLAAYRARVEGKSAPDLPELPPESLATRGNPRWIVAQPISRWQAIKGTVTEASRWVLRRPLAIHGTRQPTLQVPPQPGLIHATLTAAETHALRVIAKSHQATLNDLLIRDLFVALANWQGQQAGAAARQWLRINVPTNLRLPGESPTPSCNIVGYAFLTHRIGETQVPARLLTDVATEMDSIRRWNLGQLFLDGLSRAETIPGALRWFTRGGRCWATTVLSNMGDVRRFMQPALKRVGREYLLGDVPLLKIAAAPPVRPETNAVLLATMCRDELTMTMRAHPDRLTEDEQRQLLDRYMDELRRTAAHTPST